MAPKKKKTISSHQRDTEAIAKVFERLKSYPPVHFRDETHEDRYKAFSNSEVVVNRRMDWAILSKYNWLDDFVAELEAMHLYNFARVNCECYEEVVYEFLSSLRRVKDDQFSFQLFNTEHTFTTKDVQQFFHFDPPELCQPIISININDDWKVVSGKDEDLHHHTKASEISSLKLRLIHRWIGVSLNSKASGPDNVTHDDIILLLQFIHHNVINYTTWMLRRWATLSDKTPGTVCGSYITGFVLSIVPKFDVKILTHVPYFIKNYNIGMAGLRSMGAIKQYHEGNRNGKKVWIRIPEDGSTPPGYVEVVPEHPAAIARAAKRSRPRSGPGSSSTAAAPRDDMDADVDEPTMADRMDYLSQQMTEMLSLQRQHTTRFDHMDERMTAMEGDIRAIRYHMMPPPADPPVDPSVADMTFDGSFLYPQPDP